MVLSDNTTDLGSSLDIPSSLSDAIPLDTPVGLSDSQCTSQKRRMLDAVNRLRGSGAHLDLDIPVIVVLGSQSAGKSSLIESISGITLPRAAGTCTRCPAECRLLRSSGPWCCKVSLKIDADNEEEFGPPIFSKSQVTERIRRAQCAILNPRIPHTNFLEASPEVLETRELSFSSNSVCLEISGKDMDDLSFVDLPGLIVGGEERDARLVEQLAQEYIKKESCIILVTIACETDYENQIAHRLAARFDPDGKRTIGVLTKPDKIDPGDEAVWLSKLQSSGKDGGVEYFSVKNPDSQDIRNGITYEQAREKEAEFFSTRAPWSNLEWLYQRRLGTEKLARRLGQLLSDLISKRLPELQEEVDRLLDQTNHSIARLPSPPSSEPMAEILNLIGAFVQSVEHTVRGAPDENGLVQALREPRDQFKRAIRQTAPDFRPLKRTTVIMPLPPIEFLANEETELDREYSDPERAIFIEDVMKRANSARTRELPNNLPYIIIEIYISTFVDRWNHPSQQYFEFVRRELNRHIKDVIEDHFAQYTHGHLKQAVTKIMQNHIQECAHSARQHIKSVLDNEHEPFTMNEHYFRDYRSKFFTYYKGTRSRAQSRFIRNLESSNEEDIEAVDDALSSLARLGLSDIYAQALANLLQPDPMEAAIGIMADVRAYFQVAYKRFVDNIPMGIDRTMLRGMTFGLEAALLRGLAISSPDRCRSLLSEPEDIVERRSELQKRQQRLISVRQELVDAFM